MKLRKLLLIMGSVLMSTSVMAQTQKDKQPVETSRDAAVRYLSECFLKNSESRFAADAEFAVAYAIRRCSKHIDYWESVMMETGVSKREIDDMLIDVIVERMRQIQQQGR